MAEPGVDRVGNIHRIRGIGEHAAVDLLERGTVEVDIRESLRSGRIDRVPVHDGGPRVGAAARVGCTL